MIGLVLTAVTLYQAATATPPEYEALLVETEALEASGELDRQRQQLESQVAALVSEAQQNDRWSTVVTAEQLNGWLTMQLPIDFPELEKTGVRQPRLLLKENEMLIACQARVQRRNAVISATLVPVVGEQGWVGVEIKSVRVGKLPLPIDTLISKADRAIRDARITPDKLRYRWAESDGNTVLMFDLEQIASSVDQVRRLDTLEVRDGELLIGGRNEDRAAATVPRAEVVPEPTLPLPAPSE